MNILFLGIGQYQSIKDRGIYLDLLRIFIKHGDKVYIVTSIDSKNADMYQLIVEDHSKILKIKTGKIKKTNIIEKGINTILIDGRYIRAIKKYFSDIQFDLVLYPTPPITFLKVVEYIKKRDGASTYLLLKDIFPQNAVDMGMLSKRGLKGILYQYFRNKEKRLYKISDYIGCMSQANVDYLIAHNPEVEQGKVEICPNSTEIIDMRVNSATRIEIRKKYGIPLDKKVFVYGGNIGKPQGVPFIIEALNAVKDVGEVYFLIVGDGTEYGKIERYVKDEHPRNVKLMKRIPRDDYDVLVAACDVGLIFLDYRFTIPNFPSRLLGYMQASLPVLACTDSNTDIGKVIEQGGFGWWCKSNDADSFYKIIQKILKENIISYGKNAFIYLNKHYDVNNQYSIIMKQIDR